MKTFFQIFAICFVLSFVILLFFGGILFSNFLVILMAISLIAAAILTAFVKQDDRIRALEKQVEALSEKVEE